MRRKHARNEALVAAYRAGATLATVAAQFAMSESNAYRILVLYDATPDWSEWHRRTTIANRARAA